MIDHLDHLVLTTSREAACVDFYTRVLRAFKFGNQKINLHVQGNEFEPKAHLPVPGALDLCFIVQTSLEDVVAHLKACNWPIIEGPVARTGATSKIRSVYVRDPDFNLIELSVLI
jgi:catechol 2,3-dioxygenase-like lactoylglutathione lyase family enzyme